MSQNRLGNETSPYLLQHKDNPVHWWAWGPDALEEAKTTQKPILLSVGYAACHWCHVMAHESFEDESTANIMNDLFVNIKVDREERPDIDSIYMSALHKLGEQGGWPLTMFLTAEAEPFWGGTYFPKTPIYGRPPFTTVLKEVARIYAEENEKASQNANAIGEALRARPAATQHVDVTDETLHNLAQNLTNIMDPLNGGIKSAPKFPQVKFFEFLWRSGLKYDLAPSLHAIDTTLTHICQGGIYDHLGGGFARYSVDDRWLVPHFEKMLYDNAQLIDLLTEAWRETQNPLYAARIEETVEWLTQEMISEGGGFAASLDADSEGEEGKFYVWSKDEIKDVLGEEEATFFAKHYDVEENGNWEGKTILNRLQNLAPVPQEDETRLKSHRQKLLHKRASRIRPGWDDKVLADWNGLMIMALAKAGWVFERTNWIDIAKKAFDFIDTAMFKNERLYHSYRANELRGAAIANDYANMVAAALMLHQVTNEAAYLNKAQNWCQTLNRHYWDKENGGYYFTADDTDDLIMRTKTASDDSTPNANGTMITNLTALYLLSGEENYINQAQQILAAFSNELAQQLTSHTGLLASLHDLLMPVHIVIIAADIKSATPLLDELKKLSLPGATIQTLTDTSMIPKNSPAHEKTIEKNIEKTMIHVKPTAYICIGPQCSALITEPETLTNRLKTLRLSQHPSIN